MKVVVKKFGGTSVGSIEKIKNVANIIKQYSSDNTKVVVIVSAMSQVTNNILNNCSAFVDNASIDTKKHYDIALSTGETISASYLSLALLNLGLKALSLQGWQIPIFTNNDFGRAKILDINKDYLNIMLKKYDVLVITGFQGVDFENNITTLGRGGSDTSAVAVSASINSGLCYIYTDVEGVYTADPNLIQSARLIDKIDYDTMLNLAFNGAKIMHPRSIEIAKKYSIDIKILSTFTCDKSTIITHRNNMESTSIFGITYNHNIALCYYEGLMCCLDLIQEIEKASIPINIINFASNKIFFMSELQDITKLKLINPKIEYDSSHTKITIAGMFLQSITNINSLILLKLKELDVAYQNYSNFHNTIEFLAPKQLTEKIISSLHELFQKELEIQKEEV
jgi:aspartate kinase